MTSALLQRSRFPARCAAACARPGFTLVELVVVMIILSVLSGIIVFRVLDSGARQADVECQGAQRLLTIAAERDAASPEPQALEYDDSVKELRLVIQRWVRNDRGETGAAWQPDPVLPPVVFSSAQLVQAWVDGRPLPRNRWRVPFNATEARPSLALEIKSKTATGGTIREPGSQAAWRVTLGPDDPSAIRTPLRSGQGAGTALASTRAIDLDAAGKGGKPW